MHQYKANNTTKNKIAIIILLSITIVLSIAMIFSINQLNSNNTAINYLNTINIGTQRLVKLELSKNPNLELENELINMIEGLKQGDIKIDTSFFDKTAIDENTALILNQWSSLLSEITQTRANGEVSQNLLPYSETFFKTVDNAILQIQEKTNGITKNIMIIEFFLAIVIISLICSLTYQIMDTLHLERKNKELSEIAYIDAHTGLPNKTRCNQILLTKDHIKTPTVAFMFDLNFLKKTNDTLGHVAGDTMISDFADILRQCFPEQYFVGRFGGDEFIAFINHFDANEVAKILDNISLEVSKHNEIEYNIPVSYAFGYAISTNFPNCTYETLLDKADENMYINKQQMHEKMGEDMR